jgi:predicted secreted protein
VNWFIGIAAYVVIWWVVIFAVLPWGIRPAGEADQGHDAGAPADPRILLKALVTTAVAAVIWVGFYWAVTHDLVSFR